MAIRPCTCREVGRLFEDAVYPGLKSTPRHWPGQLIADSGNPVSQDLARRQYEGSIPFHSTCSDDQVFSKKGYTFSLLPRFRART
jgi:hypothetical protein